MSVEIVLFQPEIPQNTGNIMRTCVALGINLHLIEPLGFKLDEKRLKRSALDYFEHIKYEVYKNFDDFQNKNKGTYYFLTRYGNKPYSDMDLKIVDEKDKKYLIFGSESYGVDRNILASNIDNCFRIPTTDKVRSINLSNAVAVVAFEAMRQNNFENLHFSEPETLKGKDYLEKFKK